MVSASARTGNERPELLGKRLRALRRVRRLGPRRLRARNPVHAASHGHAKPDQSFSTWPNSSSTGVARPKMLTETRSRLFS